MSDELDSLSDAALSERVAVEVAGWRYTVANAQMGTRWWSDANGSIISPFEDPDSGHGFATSTDAVLPLANKHEWWLEITEKPDAPIRIRMDHTQGPMAEGRRDQLARLLCIALLRRERAKRAEKGGP